MASALLALILLPNLAFSQNEKQLSLEECYEKARDNYPLLRQMELIEQTKNYSVENISKGNIPQFNINGQATYQSDVTGLPVDIPNIIIEPLAKDQYKIYGEIVQPLTDFGTNSHQQAIAEANAEVESKNLEVELYQIKNRINQLFFGIMLVDGQLLQTALLKKDIQTGLDRANAGIANGIALKSDADQLKAEMLNADQKTVEMEANRKAFMDMLSIFIGEELDENTQLIPPAPRELDDEINRPELASFAAQKESFVLQSELVNKRNNPHFNLFFQGGYGRPGLNFLSNDFEFFYVTGLRLNWNISNFYTSSREKEIIQLNQNAVQLQEETFLLNTNLAMTQQKQDVLKYLKLLQTDDEIITLREKVKTTANNQLEYGSITANDYLMYVNAEDQARQNQVLHRIQLLMAQYTYQLTTGN
ncbi:outer membrane protein TolC [Algoriphagus chordae]|uniref:Outer membrane protein TolC n=2 Tax=Algoriphagus chordae TaxID=237019 RepID=A0A2W7RAU9_9BACT|nr:outer membrane protein TolC [Algoriphagus chordae]